MNIATMPGKRVNGIPVNDLMDTIDAIAANPAQGVVEFRVRSGWHGQTRSEHKVESYSLGGQTVPRRFTLTCDEPLELCGENTAANPQEMLMSALNACMMVGYVAGCAVRGIKLEQLELETTGQLDLRGFLGIDETVKPGYDSIEVKVRIKGDGTPGQFQEVHEAVLKTSPNYFNLSKPVNVKASLSVG